LYKHSEEHNKQVAIASVDAALDEGQQLMDLMQGQGRLQGEQNVEALTRAMNRAFSAKLTGSLTEIEGAGIDLRTTIDEVRNHVSRPVRFEHKRGSDTVIIER
jgi:hypothetical protein